MTRKVLTGTYASGYTLQSPVTILTVAASGSVGGYGIHTPFTAKEAYTVINLGKVNDTSGFRAGIFLYDGGSVTNGSASAKSASIAGPKGVGIYNAIATVTNFGAISGSQSDGGHSVQRRYGNQRLTVGQDRIDLEPEPVRNLYQ